MKFVTSTICALSVALALPAFAQVKVEETTTTTETTTQTEPAPTTDETFPVEGTNAKPEGPYVREKHGNWEVRCTKVEEAEKCNLYHLLGDGQGNSVAEMNIEILPAGGQAAAGVTLITPLGTLLTAQLGWRIDSGKTRRYPYSWCESGGCIARFGLTKGDIASMKKGANGKLTLVSVVAPDKPIVLELPLTGFTAAFNSIPAPAK
jgi:invasion protein IalB